MENILFFSIDIWIDYNWYILHYRLRYESDHIVNMRHEKETLDTVCEQEEKQLKKLQKVMEIVDTYVLHLFVGGYNHICITLVCGGIEPHMYYTGLWGI